MGIDDIGLASKPMVRASHQPWFFQSETTAKASRVPETAAVPACIIGTEETPNLVILVAGAPIAPH